LPSLPPSPPPFFSQVAAYEAEFHKTFPPLRVEI
jgi:hypothetical protein